MKNKKMKIVSIVLTLSVLCTLPFLMVGCNDKDKKEFVDATYYIGANFSVWNLPLDILLVKDESTIVLRKDGTMTLKATIDAAEVNKHLGALLDGGMPDIGMDISGILGDLNLKRIIENYGGSLFPGFSLNHIISSFENIEKSLGVKIGGIDFHDPKVLNFFQSINETGTFDIGILNGFALPGNISVEFNGIYRIENYHSEVSGSYKMVYCGFETITEDPFLLMNIGRDMFGNETISCFVEFIKVAIKGTTVVPSPVEV